jgi:hypothetical protein
MTPLRCSLGVSRFFNNRTFCEPKIIPLVVDTGTSHSTLNPKGVNDLGITSTVIGMLSTEGAITATGTGQYALLID